MICSPLHLLVTYSVMLESRTCWNRFESRSFLPVSRKIKPHHHHHSQHHPTATSLLNIRLSCPRGNNLSWLRPCNGSSHLLSFHCGDKLIFIMVVQMYVIVRSKRNLKGVQYKKVGYLHILDLSSLGKIATQTPFQFYYFGRRSN